MKNKKEIPIKLNHGLFKKFELLAEHNDISIEEAIITALNEYFDKENILIQKKMGKDVSIRLSLTHEVSEEIVKKISHK